MFRALQKVLMKTDPSNNSVKLILALDVHYKREHAKTVGVLFQLPEERLLDIKIAYNTNLEPYIPGQFYKRELPCILELLKQIDLSPIKVIIVDGHCYVSNDKKLGLGGHLYEALERKIPIIGVAKKGYHNTDLVTKPIYRGKSNNPLYLSCIGISKDEALTIINQLHGNYRIPTILKILDQETKKD